MARARNIKPGFFVNDQLAECSFQARLLYIGLWTLADREGRMLDRPGIIKASVFPHDNVDTSKLLAELASNGLIVRYTATDDDQVLQCIWIPRFKTHQKPHANEADSVIPPYVAANRSKVASACDQGSKGFDLNDECGMRNDVCGKLNDEENPSDSSAGQKPAEPAKPVALTEFEFPTVGTGKKSWTLPQAKLDEYLAAFPGLDVKAEIRAARQWCLDNPRHQKTASGMPRFLGQWLTRAQNRGGSPFAANQKAIAERPRL